MTQDQIGWAGALGGFQFQPAPPPDILADLLEAKEIIGRHRRLPHRVMRCSDSALRWFNQYLPVTDERMWPGAMAGLFGMEMLRDASLPDGWWFVTEDGKYTMGGQVTWTSGSDTGTASPASPGASAGWLRRRWSGIWTACWRRLSTATGWSRRSKPEG